MRETKDVKVLVVDDEAGLRAAIVFDFRRKGFQVFSAENGTEAFKIVEANEIDVVISDVKMPGGDGVELLDRIKARSPSLPVVMFVTGFADISLEEAYDRGADAVFSKPFDRKALMSAVHSAVESKDQRWSKEQELRQDVSFDIKLTLANLDQSIQAKVLNIGRGGIFVAIDNPDLQVGLPVGFEIAFENGSPSFILGNGVVRWIRGAGTKYPSGCGIEFTFLRTESRLEIISQIELRAPKAFIPKE